MAIVPILDIKAIQGQGRAGYQVAGRGNAVNLPSLNSPLEGAATNFKCTAGNGVVRGKQQPYW